MPKVRESAVSYLIQHVLPRSNILFIIEGDADVQTLTATLAYNFLPGRARNETHGEGLH